MCRKGVLEIMFQWALKAEALIKMKTLISDFYEHEKGICD